MAHRGASAAHPENTLTAFDAAVRAGADMIELDVRLTADGVPVVIHDAAVAATTDGSGLVHELTLSQVRALRVAPGTAAETRVPTLREALTRLHGLAAVEIDIKNDPGERGFDGGREAAAAEVVRLLAELKIASVLVTSTSPATVDWVARHAPHVPAGVEIEAGEDPWRWLEHSARRGHAFLLPDAASVLAAGRDLVGRAHALGIQIDAWTVDDPETIARLFAWGVDTVETDDPQAAVTVRDRARRAGG